MVDVVGARAALEEGLAHNSAGRPAEASAAFRRALESVEGASDDGVVYVRGRSLLGLAVSELELTGDLAAAEERLALAARSATGPLAVAVQGQLGLVRMRGGDTTGALAALDAAAALLADAEPLDACRILLNRGTLLLELGRLDEARADLRASAARAEAADDDVRLFKARHNLGYAHFLAGDLPAALASMAEAARAGGGGSPAVALLDRAHVLLEAGLVTEAEQLLGEAAEIFAADRMELDLAQVDLALASCALLVGEPARSLDHARAAGRRFAARDNGPWLARAELAECQARLALLGEAPEAPGAELLEVAGRAERVARAEPLGGLAAEAWLTVAEALAAAGSVPESAAALSRADESVLRSRLPLGVRACVVRARLALIEADRGSARREVRAGQQLLAEHRRQFGSVEAVAAAAVHGERLTALDVAAALETGRPGEVLEAVERGRATFAGPARVRPPDDDELSGLLSELRRTIERHRALSPDGTSAELAERDRLAQTAAELRRRARERSWQLGQGTVPERAPRSGQLVEALRTAPEVTVLDLAVVAGEVIGVVIGAGGERLERLGDLRGLAEPLRRVRSDLTMLARPLAPALASVVRSSLERGLRALEKALLAPVRDAAALHVVATGELATVPWASLPSRRGRPTTVASRLHLDGEDQGDAAPSHVVALAGPGLDYADDEVAILARTWPRSEVLGGEAATCRAAVRALATADVVHLAAHGHHEVENPVFSWVRLADGPLFAHELEGVRVPGSVVVLSACEVGRVTARAGGESLGLASVLLRLGARAVVAALAPLRDDLAAQVMPVLHEGLAAGLAPAAALALAGEGVEEPVPLTCFTAALPRGPRAAS